MQWLELNGSYFNMQHITHIDVVMHQPDEKTLPRFHVRVHFTKNTDLSTHKKYVEGERYIILGDFLTRAMGERYILEWLNSAHHHDEF